MFYNVKSLRQSQHLLTTWLLLRSSSEDIHSYATQPSHTTCSTAIPPQTPCDLPLLAQLPCGEVSLHYEVTRPKYQPLGWNSFCHLQESEHIRPRWKGSHFAFLKVTIFIPSGLRPEPVDISILKRLPIAYADQIWPPHIWSCSTQLEKSQSSSSVPSAHTQPLPTEWPTKRTRQQMPPGELWFQLSSYHFHVLVYILFTQSFHKSHSFLLKHFYAKSS